MRLGVIDAVTMVVLSLVTFPPPASAIVRYGCFLKLRPPAQAPFTSCRVRGEGVYFQNLRREGRHLHLFVYFPCLTIPGTYLPGARFFRLREVFFLNQGRRLKNILCLFL